jgi:hypothetical protein
VNNILNFFLQRFGVYLNVPIFASVIRRGAVKSENKGISRPVGNSGRSKIAEDAANKFSCNGRGSEKKRDGRELRKRA